MKRIIVALCLALSAACGGNNKSTNPITPPPPGDTTSMSYDDRTAALDAVAAQLDSLDGLSQEDIAQKVLTFVRTRPEFEASGTTGGTTVWARFTDGRLLIIPNNRALSADTAGTLEAGALESQPPSASTPRSYTVPRPSMSASYRTTGQVELPRSMQFQAFNALESCHLNPLPAIKSLLVTGKYVDGGGSATVNGLKNVKGDGVFYLDTHGGQGIRRDSLLVTSLWTANGRNASDEQAFAAMLGNGDLTYMLQTGYDTAASRCDAVVHYGITSFFVTKYMKFSPNSLVFVDACFSDDPNLKVAFTNAGAGVYVGWSDRVTDGPAFKTAKCLFDRLLGVNIAAPKENPPQRAFGTDQVMIDLHAHGLDTDTTGATLVISPLNAGAVVLAPSIEFMMVGDDEQVSHLFITGSFGTDPGEADRRVMVNGQEVTVVSWTPQNIECQIPSSGAGSEGPVMIESRADVGTLTPLAFRQSNPVNITTWRGQFVYDRTEAGTLHESMTINLVIHADIHAFRDAPHQTPNVTTVLFGDSRASDATAEASGIVSGSVSGASWSYEWSGTHDIGTPFSYDERWGVGTSSIDTKAKMMDLNLIIFTTALTSTQTEVIDGTTYTAPGPLIVEPDSCLYDIWNGYAHPELPMGTFKLNLGDAFSIVAGINTCQAEPYVPAALTGVEKASVKFEWQQIDPSYPPDPTAAQ